MKYVGIGLLLAVIILAGCGPFSSNLQKEQGLSQQTKEAFTNVTEAQTSVTSAPAAKFEVTNKDGSTVKAEVPAEGTHEGKTKTTSGTTTEEENTWSLIRKNPWTFILWGLGLIMVVSGIWLAIYLIKQNKTGNALIAATEKGVAAGLQKAVAVIKSWQAPETDATIKTTLANIENEVKDAK